MLTMSTMLTMSSMLWIIIIAIISIVCILLWWQSYDIPEFTNYPTIHTACKNTSSCGGDLVCDVICNKCKKGIGGDCAENIDCEYGLICNNWKCTLQPQQPQSNVKNIQVEERISVPELNIKNIGDIPGGKTLVEQPKKVQWNDNLNQTFYI